MRFAARFLILIIGALLLAVGIVFAASELSGEVVRLRSFDSEGRAQDTRLWVVDYGNEIYLRGRPDSGWYGRVIVVPEVELERRGEFRRFRAVPSERVRGPINQLMAEKYGFGDQFIAVFRSMDELVPIRLDPLSQ